MAEPVTAPSPVSARPAVEDLPERLESLRRIAAQAGVSTLVLTDPATIGWLTAARPNVPQTLDTACFDVVVEDAGTAPTLRVITNAIEAPRLADTELGHEALAGVPLAWTVLPWDEPRPPARPQGPDVGADRPLPGVTDLGAAVRGARLVLSRGQRAALRALCTQTAEAAHETCLAAHPTMSEYALAGVLAERLLQRGIDPICLFVGGDARMAAHRHPLPTAAPVGSRAMVVACGRRDGVVASVTRIVSFGRVAAPDRDRYLALLEVERAFLDATAAGRTLGETFTAGAEAYAHNGFAADEWRLHHQGGLSGCAPREVLGAPSEATVVPLHGVAAWNPSGDGWKVEDTCLVGDAGVEPLVADDAWPTLEVGGRKRPDVLER